MTDQAENAVEPSELPQIEGDNEGLPEIDTSDDDYEGPDDDNEESEDSEESRPEIEYEEVEIDGKTYKLPVELKDKVMMQADYTRKTQEVAKTREELDAQRQQFYEMAQRREQHFKEYTALTSIEEQIAQYENVDWGTLQRQDPNLAQQHQLNLLQLQQQRDKAAKTLQEQEQQVLRDQQSQSVKVIEENQRRLASEIEGWNTEKQKSVAGQAQKLGFTKQFLSALNNGHFPDSVQMIKALDKAARYDQIQEKAKKASKQSVEVKPSQRVQGKRSNKPNIYDPKLTPEQRINLFKKMK